MQSTFKYIKMEKLKLRDYQTDNHNKDAKIGSSKNIIINDDDIDSGISSKKQIDIIREKCEKAGLNIYDVFREAKVPSCTVSNWTKREPSSFVTLNKINSAIEKLSSEK